MIAVVDYGMGNVRSVLNALDFIGEHAVVTSDTREIANADRILLPGVGAFGDAMRNLKSRGLDEVLRSEVLEKGKPFLGVCLGMQLLGRTSTEHGCYAGLDWLDCDVIRFQPNGRRFKVPHMGWNEISPSLEHPLLANLPTSDLSFYFVHSFHVRAYDASLVAATCTYGEPFPAAIARDNIFATQFHPERSQDNGLQVLVNFARWNP